MRRRRAMLGTHYRLGAQPAANVIYTRRYRASGLGQDGFDWGSFSDIANSIGKATTSIITAARAPAGIVYPAMSTYPPVTPALPPGGGVSAIGAVSSNTLLLGGLALVGVVLLARR